jgi:hypothetical protein
VKKIAKKLLDKKTERNIVCMNMKNSNSGCFQKYTVLSFLCLAMLLAGCATDVANRYYASEKYPPKDPKQVELLWQNPQHQYVVIADFQARGTSPEEMRKWAAKIGADAVIVSILGGYYDRSTDWAGQDKMANTYSRITGTAIKYQ